MRIGVYSPNWIGDAVMALPFLQQLKLENQRSEIFIICKEWVSGIYENHPAVTEVIPIRNRDLNGLVSTVRIGFNLRYKKFDRFYTLTDSIRSAFIIWLSGSKKRYGYRSQMRSFLLTDVFNLPAAKIHRSNKYLNILGEKSSIDVLPKIHLSNEEIEWACNIIITLDLKNPIALLPYSVATSRSIPNITTKEWIKNSKRDYLIFGSNSDIKKADELISICSNNSIKSICGKYSLRQVIALISICEYALAADSGLGHISASLDIPTVSFFGAGISKITGPIGSAVLVINKDVHCSPCRKNHCINIEEPLICLKSISMCDIENAVKTLTNQ